MRICVYLAQVVHGKSYFTKVQILRQRYLNIEQYIIDPEREYINICKALNGTIIKLGSSSNTYINILDIRQDCLEDQEDHGFLAVKLTRLRGFFRLVFKDITYEEESLLEEKLIECYKQKGITFDNESCYKQSNGKKISIKPVFKSSEDMPILEDL